MACTVPDLSTLGPFSCEDSNACAKGYVCVSGRCSPSGTKPEPEPEPDDGLPPTLGVSVPPPPESPAPEGRTTYTEVGLDGRPLPAAWRRDQEVPVELSTNSSVPLVLEVKGTDGQGVRVDAVPFSEGCAARQCVRAALPLWKPRLDASRGMLTFVATARSRAGLTTVHEQALPVTRWKWAHAVFDANSDNEENSLDSAPGIGAKGTVYVTTYFTELIALSPEGRALWTSPLEGEGAPVVSPQADGRELLYVRWYGESDRGGGHQLYVYDVATRGLLGQCPQRLNARQWFDSFVLGDVGGGVEGAMTATYGGATGAFLALTGGASGSAPQCQFVQRELKPSERGNLVFRDGALYYSGPSSRALSVSTGSFTPRSGWPIASASSSGVNGLAVFDDLIVMGEGYIDEPSSSGGISTVHTSGTQAAVSRYSGGPVSMPSVGAGGVVFGVDGREGRLVRAPLGGSGLPLLSKERGLAKELAPTLGQGGLVYAMRSGEMGVWSATDLSLQWKWSPHGEEETPLAPPVLDCTRDAQGSPIPGRPGVLYASVYNELHALVVDSAGLDADAPWPKQQHDERNTGNASTAVLRCP
ncbi:hypothetical protein MEBOL_000447 [Melittangium boletus DSM 14713]|uniref:Uncharacterized protein n=2 Tax=Melittangium boletus TaxID=83453 RepID=A0A250I779_9BACT|nr:hypothetical protein MEBOL_000447 [Melittangium boletus DSM 14713]